MVIRRSSGETFQYGKHCIVMHNYLLWSDKLYKVVTNNSKLMFLSTFCKSGEIWKNRSFRIP